jgi:pimeloyl-ACP methyl ester carboxylesterase
MRKLAHAIVFTATAATAATPARGRLVDLGGHRLHLHCTGRGSPTVVIENGFDELSTDWARVQERVARTTRICTYDRAGYGWSDPGPLPRTFDQINLELRDALRRAGEKPPLVLAAHSFGGGVVRQFARTYAADVAGLVLVDIVSENQRIPMGDRAAYIADSAQGRPIPAPHEAMNAADPVPAASPHDAAADSEREWSTEYMARWRKEPQAGSLGPRPLVVLTRRHGGYRDIAGVAASELERERLESQAALAHLSSAGRQALVESGHDMQTEAPDTVSQAIEDVVAAVRKRP